MKILLLALTIFIHVTGASAVTPKGQPDPTPTPNPIRIGLILPLSGVGASKAAHVKQAVELGAKDLEGTGGLGGRAVEIMPVDSNEEGASPGSIVRTLITDKKADALIGELTVEGTLPYASLANTYQRPLLAPALFDSALPPENKYAFALFPKQISLSKVIGEFFDAQPKVRSVVLLCRNTVLGLAYRAALRDATDSRQIAVTEEICWNDGNRDFRVDVVRAQAGNPAGLFVTHQVNQVLQWMKMQAFNVPVLASAEFRDMMLAKRFELKDMRGIYFIDWEVKESFTNRYREVYGEEPPFEAALAYDAFKLIVAGLGRNPSSLLLGLRGLKLQGVAGSYDFSVEQAGNSNPAVLRTVTLRGVETVSE